MRKENLKPHERVSKRIQQTPVTSEYTLKKTSSAIAKENKARAKRMEREVARYLQGDVTPSSGSGDTKGDCIIPLVHQPGRFIIECKLSARRIRNDYAIRLEYKWLTKVEAEAKALRANLLTRYALLIFKYHNVSTKYVFMRDEDVAIHNSIAGTQEFTAFLAVPPIDLRKEGKPQTGYVMMRSYLEACMYAGKSNDAIYVPVARFITPVGTYICLHLTSYKLLLRNEL